MHTFSGTGKGLVCWEAGTSLQPSYFIGLAKVVFAGQYRGGRVARYQLCGAQTAFAAILLSWVSESLTEPFYTGLIVCQQYGAWLRGAAMGCGGRVTPAGCGGEGDGQGTKCTPHHPG